MKISYRGRVRKFNEFPKNMDDFRQTVQSKFIKCKLIPPGEDESKMLASALNEEDNSKFASMIDESIQERDANKKAKK